MSCNLSAIDVQDTAQTALAALAGARQPNKTAAIYCQNVITTMTELQHHHANLATSNDCL